ncbi:MULTISPECIES: hypothetical protein [unclassified Novosphingobium]|uniref:hypothetical protein n=1 Tax=unclassified Novosphingobium TaxID=2644732 RepID=UPI000D44D73E|nr:MULTISPECIES: hypothetical protein [unclassified Novosphingobium]PTR06702.1 hypothetical protein C8K11_11971 [Novosphingobium sp. GV055]PUA94995.1 hypothetical protein C8K12_11971 [Novosphingobium sp. GV061]PUB14123.1 hypothetical protein C8K14_11971 [Novosphingobium sp. GV079]PUB38697.1 hypothetical protein C8K10_11971 [Novosphingobium sp. GV027]
MMEISQFVQERWSDFWRIIDRREGYFGIWVWLLMLGHSNTAARFCALGRSDGHATLSRGIRADSSGGISAMVAA